jgi:hypothetical protein
MKKYKRHMYEQLYMRLKEKKKKNIRNTCTIACTCISKAKKKKIQKKCTYNCSYMHFGAWGASED